MGLGRREQRCFRWNFEESLHFHGIVGSKSHTLAGLRNGRQWFTQNRQSGGVVSFQPRPVRGLFSAWGQVPRARWLFTFYLVCFIHLFVVAPEFFCPYSGKCGGRCVGPATPGVFPRQVGVRTPGGRRVQLCGGGGGGLLSQPLSSLAVSSQRAHTAAAQPVPFTFQNPWRKLQRVPGVRGLCPVALRSPPACPQRGSPPPPGERLNFLEALSVRGSGAAGPRHRAHLPGRPPALASERPDLGAAWAPSQALPRPLGEAECMREV